ncbi:hypothetical protein L915_20441, partial [Phytophthora nicotianae]
GSDKLPFNRRLTSARSTAKQGFPNSSDVPELAVRTSTEDPQSSRTWCKRRDWRFEVRNTLGALACRKESLMNQLSRHKEVTARLKSMKYFHMTREYNAAADSLTTETAAFKTSKVVLSESQKAELREFNRIPEVIYHKSREAEVKILVSTASIQFTETVHRPTRRMIANFVRDEPHMEPHMVMATPRSQTGARKKRVRFANEVPSQDAGSQENMSHKTDRPTDDSQDEQQTGAAQAPPTSHSTTSRKQDEIHLKLVVPTTMVQEIL